MWQAILDALKLVWDWFSDLLVSFGQMAITQIIALLPGSAIDTLNQKSSVIGFALSAANAWAPIDVAVTLAGSYIVFVLGFLAVKVIIKLIP